MQAAAEGGFVQPLLPGRTHLFGRSLSFFHAAIGADRLEVARIDVDAVGRARPSTRKPVGRKRSPRAPGGEAGVMMEAPPVRRVGGRGLPSSWFFR
jgi:hypothetical protein